MVAALTLLFATQAEVKAPKRTFEEILDAANKAWYELPAATTSLRTEGENRIHYWMARDHSRYQLRINKGETTMLEVRQNGAEEVTLAPSERTYAVGPAIPRPAWAERKHDPLRELGRDDAEIAFSSSQGLILRVGAGPLKIINDALTKDGSQTRYVTAEIVRAATDDAPAGRIRFSATLNEKLGIFTRAAITATNRDKPEEPIRFVWQCTPAAYPGAEYDYDTTNLTGWTKIDPPGTRR